MSAFVHRMTDVVARSWVARIDCRSEICRLPNGRRSARQYVWKTVCLASTIPRTGLYGIVPAKS